MRLDNRKISKAKKSALSKRLIFVISVLVSVLLVFPALYGIVNLDKIFTNKKADNVGNTFSPVKITYSEGYEVRFHRVLKSKDNIVAVGTILKNADLKYQLFFVIFDANGQIIHRVEFGAEGDEWGYDLLKDGDEYIVIGLSSSRSLNVQGRYDVLVLRIDKDGNIVSYNTYGGPDWDRVYKILKVNGGYVFVGDNFMKGGDVYENYGEHDFWIVKIDRNGKIIWSKSFGGIKWDRAYSAEYDASSDTIIVVGSSNSFNDGNRYDGYVVAYDSNGQMKWNVVLSNFNTLWPTSVSIFNSEIYVGGYVFENGEEKSFISKINLSGKVEYIKTFAQNTRIQSLKPIQDDNKNTTIYFVGYKDSVKDSGENNGDNSGRKIPWYGQFNFAEGMITPVVVEYTLGYDYGMLFDISYDGFSAIVCGFVMEKGKISGLIESIGN
ncbi:MAG: hypothetical protein ACP5KD_00315 [Fervidobacterium sp.]